MKRRLLPYNSSSRSFLARGAQLVPDESRDAPEAVFVIESEKSESLLRKVLNMTQAILLQCRPKSNYACDA